MSNEISNPNRVLTKEGLSWLWGKVKSYVDNSAYELPPATASTLGGVKAGSGTEIESDGTISVPSMTGSTSSVDGGAGLVPAPLIADTDHFLAGDGTWKSGGKPMVILSYGNSSWQDFINAYNSNVIVYCRASSNSNPASGSQTRMAFMAYVNNATTPTEVEFQYYRSVNSHSATQMGDQVFVYKLTSSSGGTWTVTTREASIKTISAASGSKIGVSWSNNTVTLSNTMTAEDMPMSSSDATTVSAVLDDKADKVSGATTGNFAGFDSNGNLTDSGSKASDFLTQHQDISGKADKVQNAITGNLAGLDANGNLTDSGYAPSDLNSVAEYDDLSEFPAAGESNTVYIAKDTNIIYRWDGTDYVAVGPDLDKKLDKYYEVDTRDCYWENKTWSGLNYIYTTYMWTDGDNIYYSESPVHRVLNRTTSTWDTKTWNGLSGYFSGEYVWTDGENIYHSIGDVHYVLDKSTSTWSEKIWNGLTDFRGDYIWTDGDNIYCSGGNSSHYVLDKSTSTWSPKVWNGYTDFWAGYIWTDGDNIYSSYGSDHYVLDKSTSTWSQKTWNGLTYFYATVWTDGNNYYYSDGLYQYILDKQTSTWLTKTWDGLDDFYSSGIWVDGNNIYYSAGTDNYMLKDSPHVYIGVDGEYESIKAEDYFVLNKQKTSNAGKYMKIDNEGNIVPLEASEKIDKYYRVSGWDPKTWNGLTNFSRNNVWTDGENIYYSDISGQYVLEKNTDTWNTKIWNGITDCTGLYIWTDGDNIYYSVNSTQYVLDKTTSTWSEKVWDGLISFFGDSVWTDGSNIYYSDSSDQYVLDKSTSTWNTKTWTGLTNFDAQYIWTDGVNIYYSYYGSQYVLDKSTSTWSAKTWTGLSSFSGHCVWTDGTNIYYSYASQQYVLNVTTSTWTEKTWDGLTGFRGEYIWACENNIYYSAGLNQYVLIKPGDKILVGKSGEFKPVNVEDYLSGALSDFKGSTSSIPGTHGLVPAPTTSDKEKFLCGDGSWAIPDGGKLVVFELDTVNNSGGSYVHTTTVSEAQHDMKAVTIEVSNPAAFMSDISITTADGSITLSCDDVNGTSDVTVSCLFIANASAITSSEFDVLSNRIGSLSHLDTTAKTDLVSAVNELDGRINSLWETIYPVGSIYMSATSTSPSVLFGGTWEQLKDRFLLAAGDTYSAGTTSGSATKTIETTNLPSHSHGLNSHTHSVGAHSHGLNSHKHSVGAHSHGLNSHTHGAGTYSAASNGTHAHGIYVANFSQQLQSKDGVVQTPLTPGWSRGIGYWTSGADQLVWAGNAGAHTHSVSGSSGAASGSTANSTAFDSGAASGSTANSTAFDSGAASGNTATTGSGTALDIMPPYLSVYIWKRTA